MMYLKCLSLFIDMGVSLATFIMYQFIIYVLGFLGKFWASFRGRLGLKFNFDLATLRVEPINPVSFRTFLFHSCYDLFIVAIPSFLPG